jgi:hypothetical protein
VIHSFETAPEDIVGTSPASVSDADSRRITESASDIRLRFDPVLPEEPVSLGPIDVYRVENFPATGPIPWLDRADAEEAIARAEVTGQISEDQGVLCRFWRDYGYVILPGFFPAELLDEAWEAYERAIADGRVVPQVDRGQEDATDPFPGRVLNPHEKVPEMERIWADERMTTFISLLLGAKAMPFQTIAGHKGSEQLTHSDSIHMTTYPLGYLAANWIAFEDIAPDSGPLEYYPGSHRLPYLFSKDVNIEIQEAVDSYAPYHEKYEPAVADLILENNLTPEYFLPKKGDLLIWHANLLHGGSRRQSVWRSRKAMVCHFFAEGCVCYHDYVGALSYLHPAKARLSEFDGEAYLQANPDVREAGIDPWEHYLAFGYEEGRQVQP